jgi:predicted unusual protein kinase regulating ubiquinone biosynthesis (AarF/ABC1/UbiB family)
MTLSLKPVHLKRYKDVAWLFFKYGRSDLVKTSGLEEFVEDDERFKHKEEKKADPKASELAADLEKMGPTFVKMGQLLSTRPDLLPLPYIEALARLQDNVGPFGFDQAEKIIAEELGVKLSKAFAHIDPKPLAAASIGQVHRATMRDGREVAVKVQRPGIREQMVADLEALHDVAEFLQGHTEMGKKYEFVRMLEEFRKTLLRELDYRQEAQNLILLGKNLKEFSRIVVPQPIEDYTTSRVLTMEYIGGHKITSLSPVVRTEIDGENLAEQLFQAYLQQILVDGFFHADPHPGNALLTQDSCIALLDLGMVARVTPRLQDGLLQILLGVSEGRGEDVARTLTSICEKRENFDETLFVKDVSDMVARHKNVNLKQMAVGRVMMEVSKIAADSGVRVPSEFSALGKTLLNLDILGTTLDPEFNPNESIRRNATNIMRRRFTSSFTPGNVYSSVIEAKEFAQRLPGRVNKILDLIANNELQLNVDAIDEKTLMTGFQKVANRITVGLLLASMIIGAALLTRVPTDFTLLGYPILATVLFLAAVVGGVILLVQILFTDEPNK